MWTLTKIIGKRASNLILIANYRGKYNLSEEMLKEWAILDTFDMLSPKYDHPQDIKTIKN